MSSDTSFYDQRICEETVRTQYELQRPSVLFRPKLGLDGNKYYVLYGENLQAGIAGFGDTADEAMRAFDHAWVTEKAPTGRTEEK